MAPSIDRASYEALVRAHHAAVYRSAHRVLRHPAAAEDVTQDVFLRVLDGRLGLGKDPAEARGVLCWWAVRTAWNQRRGEARRVAREEEHAMTRTSSEADEAGTDDLIWRAVEDLPDELRVPVVLRFVEGMTFARIGAALGIGESAAHERVTGALARLRTRLAPLTAARGLVAPALEEVLNAASAAGPSRVEVPADLAARLLALEVGRAAASLGVMVTVLTVAALGAVGAWAVLGPPAGGGPSDTELAEAASPSASAEPATRVDVGEPPAVNDAGRAPVAVDAAPRDVGPTEPGPMPTARLFGRAVDEDGAPLAGLDVRIESFERAGKSAAHSAVGRTDINGCYEVEVQVAEGAGGLYMAAVLGRTRIGRTVMAARARAGERVDLGTMMTRPPTEFTDLEGFAPSGPPSSPGVVTGTVAAWEGAVEPAVASIVSVHVQLAPSGEWRSGEVAPDGTFTLTGLPLGKHRVQLSQNFARSSKADTARWSTTWFDVELTANRLESHGHVVLLKRADETRDVGHHAAELHARAVRHEDGVSHPIGPFATELLPAPDLDHAALRTDWWPNHLFPRPVQRMLAGPPPLDTADIHVTGLMEGRYVLLCHADGRAAAMMGPVELGPREVRSGFELRLAAPCALEGQVVAPDGAPLDGAFVLVTGIGPYSDGVVAEGDRAIRDADGRGFLFVNGSERRSRGGVYTLDGLPPGLPLRLVALHPRYQPVSTAVFTLQAGERWAAPMLQFSRAR